MLIRRCWFVLPVFSLCIVLTGCIPVTLTPDPEPTETLLPSATPTISPSTLHVPGEYSSIQAAISAAEQWDEVVVAPGRYTETIDLLGKSITVRSQDPLDPAIVETTILDGGGRETVVAFTSGEGRASRLEGFTITNGRGRVYMLKEGESKEWCGPGMFGAPIKERRCGGGIVIEDSSPTIANNRVEGNQSTHAGGGIYIVGDRSKPLLEDNLIQDNLGSGGGGIFIIGGAVVTLRGNEIVENRARLSGGGGLLVEIYSQAILEENLIQGNISPTGAGVMAFNHAILALEGNTILENRTEAGGGGVFVGPACQATMTGNLVQGNNAAFGAGVFMEIGAEGYFEDNSFVENVAGYEGAGINVAGGAAATISNNRFAENQARFGAGIEVNDGFALIERNTFEENSAVRGAAIAIVHLCQVELAENVFIENVAEDAGGAIWISSESTVTFPDPDDQVYQENRPDDVVLEE